MRSIFASIVSLLLATSALAEFRLQSGPTQVPLLELYTSEGCSSCPQADVWMSKLKTDQGLWSDFVPISFHVDYWDRLGWKDRFANQSFTKRQYLYAQIWKNDTVYTPGLVLGGVEWRDWRKFREPPVSKRVKTGVLSVESENMKSLKISFEPVGSTSTSLTVRVAVLGIDQSTSVARGENKGQTLHHDFVALSFDYATLEPTKADKLSATIKLKEIQKKDERLALAVWVERPNDPRPIQAVGGWFEKSE